MKNKRIPKTRLAVLTASLLCVIAGYLFLTQWMKANLGGVYPDSVTLRTMHNIRKRTLHYAMQNNALPHTVDELPVLEGFYGTNADYWGGKIIIQVEGTTVSLISFGSDVKLGGLGVDLDLIAVFEAKTASGSWADENEDRASSWKKLPDPRLNTTDYWKTRNK